MESDEISVKTYVKLSKYLFNSNKIGTFAVNFYSTNVYILSSFFEG